MQSAQTSPMASEEILHLSGESVLPELAVGERKVVFHTTKKKATVNLSLQQNSELHYVLIADNCDATLRSTLADSARMHWHIFTLGSGSYSLTSELTGPNAVSQIDWTFKATKKEKQTIDVRNVFSARSGGGEILLKGIAEDHATVKANGEIKIGLQGGGTQTHLTEEVLMLDATAKVDAIPGLEIKTNDVKASHSATVSRVTPEQLFYLQSRGLPEDIARTLFIDGFLGEMIARVPESVRAELRAKIV